MKMLETERLILREIKASDDEFILELLNQPSFIKYIGDRNVRGLEQAREFIETRYRASYAEHGFGLYAVELKISDSKFQIPNLGIRNLKSQIPRLESAVLLNEILCRMQTSVLLFCRNLNAKVMRLSRQMQ